MIDRYQRGVPVRKRPSVWRFPPPWPGDQRRTSGNAGGLPRYAV